MSAWFVVAVTAKVERPGRPPRRKPSLNLLNASSGRLNVRKRGMRSSLLLACVCIAGCSDPASRPDATLGIDSLYAPDMIIVSGSVRQTSSSGTTPLADVGITLHHYSHSYVADGEATTDPQGNFSITIVTANFAPGIYIVATKTGFKDTILYPPGPLTDNFAADPILLLTAAQYSQMFTQLQVTPDPSRALVRVRVTDGTASVEGAMLSNIPAPGAYGYSDPSTGLPAPIGVAEATAVDGIGYLVNAPDFDIVNATKSGVTFFSHTIEPPADQLTMTSLVPR